MRRGMATPAMEREVRRRCSTPTVHADLVLSSRHGPPRGRPTCQGLAGRPLGRLYADRVICRAACPVLRTLM